MNAAVNTPELPLGLHDDIRESRYHADRSAVSTSWLKKLNKSPAHLKHYLEHGGESNEAMNAGSYLHHLLLGSDESFCIGPLGAKRGSNAWNEWAAVMPANAVLFKPGEEVVPEKMAEAVLANPEAASLLRDVQREVTGVWLDETTGLRCKFRADIKGSGFMADIKSTVDADPDVFYRQAAKMGYHLQQEHYVTGNETLTGNTDDFVFIAVEKTEPYCVGVYELPQVAIDSARNMRDRLMNRLHECKKHNQWPGYTTGLHALNWPVWAIED